MTHLRAFTVFVCVKTRQSKKEGLGVACVTCSREERCILSLDGKPEGKRSFGSPRSRWY